MDSQRPSVSLKKAEPWTDPVTGEIYPGGNPNLNAQNRPTIPREPQAAPKIEQYTPFAAPTPMPREMDTTAATVAASVSGNMKHCTHCGAQIPSAAKFCSGCGTDTGTAGGDNVKYCTHCRARLPYKAMFCSECGTAADTAAGGNVKYCTGCGGQIPSEAMFCSKCGKQTELTAAVQQPQPIIINNNIVQNMPPVVIQGGKQKSKWLSFILCFFFGIWGVHRFYEGKIGTGLLWLFTAGMFGIGWLVDLIIILTKSDPYYV